MSAQQKGTPQRPNQSGPHPGGPVVTSGTPLGQAAAAMIVLHGRGATAENILGLAGQFDRTDFAYLAPQAAANSWYPYSFLAPLEDNEPALSSALQVVADLVKEIVQQGMRHEQIWLAGFSQGACLSLEFAVRNPGRYGGVIGLSGGLIGPPGIAWNTAGSLGGTPVFLGCGDMDSHIPVERVHESAGVMRRLEAHVTERIYPGMGHGVNEDELQLVRQLLSAAA